MYKEGFSTESTNKQVSRGEQLTEPSAWTIGSPLVSRCHQFHSLDAVGSSEDVAGGDETAPTGVPPCVILEILKRDLQKDHTSALWGYPALPLPLLHLPRSMLTCQGQLLGAASSPPTTLVDKLGGKAGFPQLEAGERGERR